MMDDKELCKNLVLTLGAILGPGLLGAMDDEDIRRDFGELGLSIVRNARMDLHEAKKNL
ncbi:MAG TPA: hypothetical protein GXX64_08080 [Bacteroidales bacterium]|jgi:hypothetical protein|nr:hypothetical protein [Bacteroidales bacterium]